MRHRLAAAALAALCLSACSGSDGDGDGGSEDGGRFVAAERAAYPLACLEHQPDLPGSAYTGGREEGDTVAILAMLEYYTANKAVRDYCDGEGPSENDRAWARLYIELGADETNVDHLLG